ncbi:MAG: MFS transporter [Anaerolineaceae bacterium]|nr:MAG: MFS transporter [Anaerolineaceae bacterium]
MSTRKAGIMIPLMVGVSLSPLNVVFTSIALPTMRGDFDISIEQATWVGTAYLIPSVAFMPLQGYVGERWGVRRVYAAGLLVLATGAFLSVLAPDFGWLLASRVVQGIGWSALYPLAMVMIRFHFASTRQGEMMGFWESAVGATTIVAPLLGGAMVQFFGWPSLYAFIGAVAALGLLLTLWAVPTTHIPGKSLSSDFDWSGALQFTLVLILLLVGIVRQSLLLLLGSVLMAMVWLVLARRKSSPFVAPQIFTNRCFVSASMAANMRILVAMAVLIALPLFFEDVQGLVPVMVGSLLVIYSVFLFLGSWPGGRWADRSGAHIPGTVGFILMIAGVLLLLGLDMSLNVLLVAIALSIRGIGAGLSQAPFAKAAVDAVTVQQRQSAAALYGTIRFSGLALGTALVGIFLDARLSHYGAQSGGAAALRAYRELWLLLAALAAVGLAFTWIMAKSPAAQPVQAKS